MKYLFFFIALFPLGVKAAENSPQIPEKQLWPLKLIDADSHATSEFKRSVTVAVIDTGIDKNHKFLAQQLWSNPGETGLDAQGINKSTNQKDDDNNGYIDDVNGWNFADNSSELADRHGHGSHVAGIIASTSRGGFSNSVQVSPVKLMILKYYESHSSAHETLRNTIKAIDYAVRNGAHIINYSGGGLRPNGEELAALRRASAAGVLVVAAAGNEASNSDLSGYYPANYDLSNIISVAAVNSKSKIIESSNFGIHNVDIAAPGEDVVSSLSKGEFGLMTGTSQATAFVTAAAGILLASRHTIISPQKLIQHLLQTAKLSPGLQHKIGSGALLNLNRSRRMSLHHELVTGFEIENYLSSSEAFFSQAGSLHTPTFNGVDHPSLRGWTQALLLEAKTIDLNSLQ